MVSEMGESPAKGEVRDDGPLLEKRLFGIEVRRGLAIELKCRRCAGVRWTVPGRSSHRWRFGVTKR